MSVQHSTSSKYTELTDMADRGTRAVITGESPRGDLAKALDFMVDIGSNILELLGTVLKAVVTFPQNILERFSHLDYPEEEIEYQCHKMNDGSVVMLTRNRCKDKFYHALIRDRIEELRRCQGWDL